MSLNNDVRLMGFCAAKPTLKTTQMSTPMATLVIYTQDYIKDGKPISQTHRCVFFGKRAEMIAKVASKGRHIHLRGSLRSQCKGEGKDRRYYTSILVEEFRVSPRQSVEALKDTLREIIDENNITTYDQLGILCDGTDTKEN